MRSCIPLKPSRIDPGAIGPGCLYRIFPKKNGKIKRAYKKEIIAMLEANYCVSENDDEKLKLVFYPNRDNGKK